MRKNFDCHKRPGRDPREVLATAPTYVRNIQKGKKEKKSWYQYIFLGVAPKSLGLPIAQLHGCTPDLALISSACSCSICQRRPEIIIGAALQKICFSARRSIQKNPCLFSCFPLRLAG